MSDDATPPPETAEDAAAPESSEPAKERSPKDRLPSEGEALPDDDGEEPESDDAEAFRQNASTIVNILRLNSGSTTIGSADARQSSSTRSIKVDAISATLTAFCPSEAFRRAEKVLANHGMVVLIGDQNSGRYAAAVGLLAGWPHVPADASISSLSPTVGIRELARPGFLKKSRRYLVHDMQGEGVSSAERRFELAKLRQSLAQGESRLVVTAEAHSVSRSDFGDLAVSWDPPTGRVVFEEHYVRRSVVLDDADLDSARSHACSLERPAEVAAFVARLAEHGLEAAMQSQSTEDHDRVVNWFVDQKTTLADKLTLAAVCFLHRVSERTFERCHARLVQLFKEYQSDSALTAGRTDAVDKPWANLGGLVGTIDGPQPFDEGLVAFRSSYLREYALIEIWKRCGHRFTEPLRQWIHEIVRDVSTEVRVQAAIGVTLLAHWRWGDITESFLFPWSNGVLVYRLAAANLLSFMAASDELAPRALRIALDWSESQGPRRAMTAAIAFGGPLRFRYLQVAFNQLWYLTSRASRIATTARIALAMLLTGADEDQEQATKILRYAVAALEWSTENNTPLERRHSVTAIEVLLSAQHLASDGLAIATLLRNGSEAVAKPIGILLAEVLASGPHHHSGVDLLRALLIELTEADEPLVVAHRLGQAVLDRWDDEQRRVLAPQLERALTRSAGDADLAREVIRSFIRSFDKRGD